MRRDEPANPVTGIDPLSLLSGSPITTVEAKGLTIRESFIKAAMEGLCANPNLFETLALHSASSEVAVKYVAWQAIIQADAVLLAMEKEKS
jgi:hypothetical protein